VNEDGTSSTEKTLADKIDHLLKTVHPAGRGPYTYAEIERELRRLGKATISGSYLWQLHKGERDNPTKKHLEALASFFGVPPAYFFDDELASRVEAELADLVALRDAGVRNLAQRAAGLPPRGREAVRQIIEALHGADANQSSEDPDENPHPGGHSG
jgi:ESX-1-secreted protein regulator